MLKQNIKYNINNLQFIKSCFILILLRIKDEFMGWSFNMNQTHMNN